MLRNSQPYNIMQDYIVNLNRHIVTDAPLQIGSGMFQRLALSPDTGEPVYTLYKRPAFILAEIVYSRLCNAIGLSSSCVNACFGETGPGKWVSVSPYSSSWIRFDSWWENPGRYSNVANIHAWQEHKVLNLFLQDFDIKAEGAGYIMPDYHFVKANNGMAISAMRLDLILRQNIDVFEDYRPTSETFASITQGATKSRSIADRLAALTAQQINNILDFPEYAPFDKGRLFFSQRLEVAQDCARKCVNLPK